MNLQDEYTRIKSSGCSASLYSAERIPLNSFKFCVVCERNSRGKPLAKNSVEVVLNWLK